MAQTTTLLTLAAGQQLADAVVRELTPGCQRIAVAGSIRRRKKLVNDVEIVAIPKRAPDLLGGDGDSLLDPVLLRLIEQGKLRSEKGGERYKQFTLVKSGVKLDLFLCTPERWGVIFTLRTGSADFSERLVTQRKKGGLLPSNLRVHDGRVWDQMTALDTPEEADVFRVAGLKWIEPSERK